MSGYLWVKWVHQGTAFISICGFICRYLWMLQGSHKLRLPWVRRAPHVVDTLLLTSALYLAATSGQYPLAQHWLTAKVCALVVYISLGMVALGNRWDKSVKALAGAAAIVVFAYIVSVALSRNPLIFI